MQRTIRMAFVLVDSKLLIFRFDNQIEQIKKEGDKNIYLDEMFWEWWKKEVDYIDDDVLDLCFIWDRQEDILQKSEFFSLELQSEFWNQREVLNLLEKCQIDAKVLDAHGRVIRDAKKSSKELHSNVVWSEFVSQSPKQLAEASDDKDGRSEAWWYFENKRRERAKKVFRTL